MPLTDDQRIDVEQAIIDLHNNASKVLESDKDVHKKVLEVSVEEAIEMFDTLKEDIADDDKIYDYKMHMLMPFHIYELMKLREEKETEE